MGAFTDISHGAGLAILYPNWMRYVMPENVAIFKQYAINVWNIDPAGKTDLEIATEGIDRTQQFFQSVGAPTTLTEAKISKDLIPKMAQVAALYGPQGNIMPLYENDIRRIFELSL